MSMPLDLLSGPSDDIRDAHSPLSSRPYRSHKIPACDFCRRRKSRCIRDRTDQPCSLCRMHRKECSTRLDNTQISGSNFAPKSKRKKARGAPQLPWPPSPPQSSMAQPVASNLPGTTGNSLQTGDNVQSGRNTPSKGAANQASHIISPAAARDAQILEQYMSPVYKHPVSHARPNPYSVYSDDPQNPVVYMKVPRQRAIFPMGNGTPGYKQFEIMEKILEPLGDDLIKVYFENVHPSFPILDEKTVIEAYRQESLPHALVCEIYAVTMISWTISQKIRESKRPLPDVRYIWHLAVSSMNDDFLSPSFSTVLVCILDLLGRPITSITYNAVNIGRLVALSQSIGLNRNPSNWNLDPRQKSLRIRTWWGVIIHDTWASLSHGTPNHIHRNLWDVPLPDFDSLLISPTTSRSVVSEKHIRGGHSFIALCRLTEILGEILPLIYNLQPQKERTSLRALRRLETVVEDWEDSLPEWLSPNSAEFDRNAPGSLNLQLSFLIIKMCFCRISLQEAGKSNDPEDVDSRQYCQARCRRAAKAVIDFVLSLSKSDMDGSVFWLPYTAYHFTSAATLTLRCALEANSDEIARDCVDQASSLIAFLRKAKDKMRWDLADICLTNCEAVVTKMSEGDYLDFRRRNSQAARPGKPLNAASDIQNPPSGVRIESSTSEGPLESAQASSRRLGASFVDPHLMDSHTDQSFLFNSGDHLNSLLYEGNDGIYGDGIGMMPDSPYFADLWQMPQPDGLGNF